MTPSLHELVTGLQAANKFMIGAAIAYNIKKWLNHKAPKVKTAAMAIKKNEKSIRFHFFTLPPHHYHLNA